MLNQIVLVGRLVEKPIVEENENGRKVSTITLAVTRSFKNSEGLYDNDFIPVILWDVIASNTSEYCKKGDLIGIKGRIQSSVDKIQVIAEKVTFLSSKASSKSEE